MMSLSLEGVPALAAVDDVAAIGDSVGAISGRADNLADIAIAIVFRSKNPSREREG
jgi:hypothetical protein